MVHLIYTLVCRHKSLLLGSLILITYFTLLLELPTILLGIFLLIPITKMKRKKCFIIIILSLILTSVLSCSCKAGSRTLLSKNVYTLLHLSENHKELLFYSKTWLFSDVDSKSFQETQDGLFQTLCDLYGDPLVQNKENNLLYFDRNSDPHTKIYAAHGVWRVTDQIIVILHGGGGLGNIGIYTHETVNDDIYNLEINYRIDTGTRY